VPTMTAPQEEGQASTWPVQSLEARATLKSGSNPEVVQRASPPAGARGPAMRLVVKNALEKRRTRVLRRGRCSELS
jgi:hypothetical protein